VVGTTPFGGKPTDQTTMNAFPQEPPQDGDGLESHGPVLLMPPPQSPTKPNLWLQRIWLVVFVLFCLEVGIILTALPWTPIWTNNSLLLGYPQVRDFLMRNFVRGLVSGLGLVDIWMGVAEAVRYRETP
jgi:hypothetical protein